MASSKSSAAIEFLHFLADVSDPATGAISCLRLAAWLGMTEDALRKRWIRRGPQVAWQTFVDELLGVLDAAQAQGHGLEKVIDWYLNILLERGGQRTADQIVIAGEARWLTCQLDTFSIEIDASLKKGERLYGSPSRG